jgi:hypothetical protein
MLSELWRVLEPKGVFSFNFKLVKAKVWNKILGRTVGNPVSMLITKLVKWLRSLNKLSSNC